MDHKTINLHNLGMHIAALHMHIVSCACTVNTSSQGKNNEASDSILVSWFNPMLKTL